ncbi:uncharacterized protein [Dysidea avara]|uniref:uncharacterized protein isoform X2 n=1 Tax=Dysidea avara TaxID=196820 RepID=UPI0033253E05
MSMKIAVVLQHREKSTPKPWRFNPSDIQNYCLADVEEDVLKLFPDVAKRGSRLIFRYKDSLVGEVELESDRDLRDCLQSFTEESDVKYKTFYLTEKRKPRDLPTSSDPASPKVKKKRESENLTATKEHIEATLANTVKEVGLSSDDQPLYIDAEDNLVKCKWCGKNFAGSNQVRCINQHVRKSVSHRRARQQHLPSDEGAQAPFLEMDSIDDTSVDHSKLEYGDDIVEVYLNTEPQDGCQGIYDKKYVELFIKTNQKTAEKLWEDIRKESSGFTDITVDVICTCCNSYQNWRSTHPSENTDLVEYIASQATYKVFPNKTVSVLEKGVEVQYTGAVHSNICTGRALGNGEHPYQCDPCYSLITSLFCQ